MSWEEIRDFFISLSWQKVLPVILILLVGFLLVKLLLKLFDRALSRSKLDKTMFTFLKATMRALLYSIVILIAAGSLGIDVTSLVAVLSVVSLAISLAVQNVLTNLVGGVTLLTAHPFRVGDCVQIGADSGEVREIGLHYTKLLTFNGELIYIPNSEVVSSRVCNFTVEGKRRIQLTVSAAYDADSATVKEALLAAARQPSVLEEPAPEAFVSEYADSAVRYLLNFWASSADYSAAKFAVTEAVQSEFAQRNISIPFPQMDVHINK